MAAWLAKTCFLTPTSSWVYQLIEGCGGEFAITFKRKVHRVHGVPVGGVPWITCWYPNVPAAYFQLAQAWPSRGHFVREFLFKKQPYRIIPNPCPAADCNTGTCNQCVAAPVQWKVAFSGLTNGSCTECGDLNTTFTLDNQAGPGIDCRWQTQFDACGIGIGDRSSITLEHDNVLSRWALIVALHTPSSGASYYLDDASFQCLGRNAMVLDPSSVGASCRAWPAVVLVVPA